MLTPLAALPIAALIGAGLWTGNKVVKTFLLACLFLVFAPLLIFTNLHVVHSYYQASNQIFLLMAVAGSASTVLDQKSQKSVASILVIATLTLVVITNLESFYSNNWHKSQRMTSDKLAVGKLIQSNTSIDSAILVFGDDWSSAFAYHSKRRAFTQPDWPNLSLNPNSVLQSADQLLGGLPVGAVVSNKPINARSLATSCPTAQHRIIKRWHVYLCRTISVHQL